MTTALLLVDIQRDFCEGGSLAVTGGAEVARRAAELVAAEQAAASSRYTSIVATSDWHIDPGAHWAPAGSEPDYVQSWPVHCEVGTPGVEIHPALAPQMGAVEEVFRKGEYEAAYSGFEGAAASDGVTRLADWLRARGITALDVAGIATDHCVRATVLDARREGLEVRVLTDLVAGVAPDSTEAALAEMTGAGATLA